MAEAPIPVALLVGDLGRRGEVGRLALLVGRLARRGIAARVLAAGGAAELAGRGVEATEDPWLGRAWLATMAARRADPDDPGPPPALVHAMHDEVDPAAAAIARRWQVPRIRTVEDYPAAEGHAPIDPGGIRAIVAGDEGLARLLSARSRRGGDRVRMIVPGVEPAPEAMPGDGRPAGPPPGGHVPVVGAMGRLGAGSGFEAFLAAIHRVAEAGRDVEFLVAGLGTAEARLRRRAERLGIADRLTFAGPSALESSVWGAVDLYCQPAAVATVGRPLMAAMAAGRPCIAADVPGLRELLDGGGRGLLVPPGDASAFARAIVSLLDRPPLARSLADRARSWAVTRFDPEREADELAALYAEVARDSSPATRRS